MYYNALVVLYKELFYELSQKPTVLNNYLYNINNLTSGQDIFFYYESCVDGTIIGNGNKGGLYNVQK